MESNSLMFNKVKGSILLAKVFLFIHEILTLESTTPLANQQVFTDMSPSSKYSFTT